MNKKVIKLERKVVKNLPQWTINAVRTILIIAVAIEIINFNPLNWLTLFVTIFALGLTFVPRIIEKRLRIDIPIEFEGLAIVFIYASIFLGEIKGYYTKYWWWDSLLHATSGIALCLIGFMILYVLYKREKLDGSPRTIAFFSFCFALALGAVWEIFEYSMDNFFGLNMQKTGLDDTMKDLIVDAIGALLVSTIAYYYMKYGKLRFFENIVKKFDNVKLD